MKHIGTFVRTTVASLSLLTLTASGMLAQAPEGQHMGRGAQGLRSMRGIIKQLALTDAQKEQAKAIFQNTRTSTQSIRTQLQDVRQQLRAAQQANDPSRIQALSRQQGELAGQLRVAHAEAASRFRALLTPEQQAKADQLKAERAERWKNRQANRMNGFVQQ